MILRYSTVKNMGMFLAAVVYFLYFTANVSALYGNNLPAHIEHDKCIQLEENRRRADRESVVQDPSSSLAGKWVSEGCEVRPGPEYIIRSYTFNKNNTFHLLQFYYADKWCTEPLYTVSASGHLQLGSPCIGPTFSWGRHQFGTPCLIPGAADGDYTLSKVTITTHNRRTAESLAQKVNTTCPGHVRKRWRTDKEYLLYNAEQEKEDETPFTIANNHYPPPVVMVPAQQRRNVASGHQKQNQQDDVDCLDALNIVFHELQLVKVQIRPSNPLDFTHPQPELLLGDLHSRVELRSSYRPTAFQTPLLLVDKAYRCSICDIISRASEHTPPHLDARPSLPIEPSLAGEWVSTRCETRPLGCFLVRRLRFYAGERVWQGEYNFFSDPKCLTPSLNVNVSGKYSSRGSEMDFYIQQTTLEVLETGLARNLGKQCGGPWRVGMSRELRPYGGCNALGISVPSADYETVRIEMDHKGSTLLYMGQPDTDNCRRGPGDRPTAYQLPLVQCSDLPLPDGDLSNDLYPMPYAQVGHKHYTTSSSHNLCFSNYLFIVLVIFRTFL